MIKNKIVRKIALLISLITLLTSTVNTTFGFIVTKTDSLINTFVPLDHIVSTLSISKSIEHPFGDNYIIPDNVAFDFKVHFGSHYAKAIIKTTAGNITADEDGSIQIAVKPGKSFAVEGIDKGTKVTVTEIQKEGTGFAVKDGAATMEGVVDEDGSLNFQYTNVYTPAGVRPSNVFVRGYKKLHGRDWQNGDTFSFALEQKTSDDTWVTLGTKTITYRADDATFHHFDFSDLIQAITFEKVGLYEFRMTEVVGDLENVDYDKSMNPFFIRVTDSDMDGKLEINAVTAGQNATVEEIEGNYNVNVTFNNTFTPVYSNPDDITVTVDIHKTVKNTGDAKKGPDGFEFVLENPEKNEKHTQTSDADGNATFTLPFTAADIGKTYSYKLYELDKGLTGMIYDTTVYDLSVSIAMNEENKLSAQLMVNGQKCDENILEFVNTYHVESSTAPDTGDNSNITVWFFVMILSGSACIFLIITDRKYRSK